MTTPLTQKQLNDYLCDVRDMGSLEEEIRRIQMLMVEVTKQKGDVAQQRNILHINQIFRTLLAEKARYEIVENVGNYNSGSSENSSACPTDNSTRSISIRYILKQHVPGS
jgi:uncharacterized protein YbgA (DUF1722 family)